MKTKVCNDWFFWILGRKIFRLTVFVIAALLLYSINTNAGNKGYSIIWKLRSGEVLIVESNSRKVREFLGECESSNYLFCPEVVDLSTGFTLWNDGMLTWDMTDDMKRKQYEDLREKKSYDEWVLRANYFTKSKHYDVAAAVYTEIIREYPENGPAYLLRGICYGNSNQREKLNADINMAIEKLGKAIEKKPKELDYIVNRAQAYFINNNFDKAWDDVHRVEELGGQVDQGFLKLLRQVSGRQK